MSAAREGAIRGLTQALVLFTSLFMLIVMFGVFVFAVSVGIGAGMASAAHGAAPGFGGDEFVMGNRQSGNRLLEISVIGPILGVPPKDPASQFFLGGLTFGYDLQERLERAAARDDVKGVLLHLQTPGGTIFGSRAIHDGIAAYRKKTGKPVLAWVEGLSASGGVMAMVGATEIYADHGSFVGSIGVLGPSLTYYNRPVATDGGLLGSGITTEGGIEQTIVSAGRGKDIGNPFRRPTEEELAVLRQGVNTEYDRFVTHVATNRHIDPATIRDQMGALIFDNAQAQHYRLIDGTRTRNEAVARLAELAKLGSDYQLVRPRADRPAGLFWRLLGSSVSRAMGSPAADVRSAWSEWCAAATRYPLAYFGDPLEGCR